MAVSLEICVDCVTADANGPDAEGIDPSWPGFLPEWSGWVMVTLLQNGGEPHEPFFGKAPCDGCGSGLAGNRFYYLAVPR